MFSSSPRIGKKKDTENTCQRFFFFSYLLPIQRNYHPPYPSPLRSSVDEWPLHEFSLGTGRETLDVEWAVLPTLAAAHCCYVCFSPAVSVNCGFQPAIVTEHHVASRYLDFGVPLCRNFGLQQIFPSKSFPLFFPFWFCQGFISNPNFENFKSLRQKKSLPFVDIVLVPLRRRILEQRLKKTIITLEPIGKASFIYNCMQTRLMGHYNGKWPIIILVPISFSTRTRNPAQPAPKGWSQCNSDKWIRNKRVLSQKHSYHYIDANQKNLKLPSLCTSTSLPSIFSL